jgi:hypothetical protein
LAGLKLQGTAMANSNVKLPGIAEMGSGPELRPGCRVQLTPLGAERCPKLQIRTGTILSEARNANGFRVQFDGAKHPQTLHRTYITPVDQPGPSEK